MPCYRPLSAFQRADGAVVFSERRQQLGTQSYRSLDLACGQCIGCRLERSRQWAMRCMDEAQLHEENCTITLTYDSEHLPANGSLQYEDFAKFIRSLRKRSKRKIRFYMGGEYGEETRRPHYHACLFGIDFHETRKYYATTDARSKLYTDELLSKAWGKGHATIGDLTFEMAAYIARYIMKKVTGDLAAQHYAAGLDPETGEIYQLTPEFNQMSRKPGIGAGWIDKYESDVYPEGTKVVRGHLSKAPKYYDRRYKARNPDGWEITEHQREKGARITAAHNKNERLATREKVATAKVNQLKRKL